MAYLHKSDWGCLWSIAWRIVAVIVAYELINSIVQ